MKTVRIGGVPEHFNSPFRWKKAKAIFEKFGFDLHWEDYISGTGDLCKALRTGELETAVLLTEGIVADIQNGNPSKILQVFVESPLIWGAHVAATSDFRSLADFHSPVFAISRFGSGSHLMAYLMANNQRWNINADSFLEVGTVKSAIQALNSGEAQLFLWEKFTTKPFVDNGDFRRLGELPTPWSCFSVAVSDRTISDLGTSGLQDFKKAILESVTQLEASTSFLTEVSRLSALPLEDVREWWKITSWHKDMTFERSMLLKVHGTLNELGLISQAFSESDFLV